MQILDVRLDKSFSFGRFGRLTGMLDMFNIMNSGVVTSVRVTTVNYNEVLAILNPRVIRLGAKFSF